MIFKIRYATAGGHVHATLFVAPGPQQTFAKAGDLVLRYEELGALRQACPGVEFCLESLAGLEGHKLDAHHQKLSQIARQRWANWSPEKRQQVREKIGAGFAKKRGAD